MLKPLIPYVSHPPAQGTMTTYSLRGQANHYTPSLQVRILGSWNHVTVLDRIILGVSSLSAWLKPFGHFNPGLSKLMLFVYSVMPTNH